MIHPYLKDQLFAYHDDALGPAERASVDAHLAVCDDCRASLKEWRTTSAVFFPARRAVPPEGFVQGVMDRLEKEPSPGFFRRFFPVIPRLVLAGAAVAALFFVLPPRVSTPAREASLDIAMAVPFDEPGDVALNTSIEDYFL
jgi:anti-sigma factor RsiW